VNDVILFPLTYVPQVRYPLGTIVCHGQPYLHYLLNQDWWIGLSAQLHMALRITYRANRFPVSGLSSPMVPLQAPIIWRTICYMNIYYTADRKSKCLCECYMHVICYDKRRDSRVIETNKCSCKCHMHALWWKRLFLRDRNKQLLMWM
jgi:hypothetical protein